MCVKTYGSFGSQHQISSTERRQRSEGTYIVAERFVEGEERGARGNEPRYTRCGVLHYPRKIEYFDLRSHNSQLKSLGFPQTLYRQSFHIRALLTRDRTMLLLNDSSRRGRLSTFFKLCCQSSTGRAWKCLPALRGSSYILSERPRRISVHLKYTAT